MRRVLVLCFFTLMLTCLTNQVFSENVGIEEVEALVQSLNEKARVIPLGEEGWIFYQTRSQVTEKSKGLQLPYDHYSDRWLHVNSEGLVDIEFWYLRTDQDGRRLFSISDSKSSHSGTGYQLVNPMKPFEFTDDFNFIADIEAMNEPDCREVEAKIEEVERSGKNAILIETVCHISYQFKAILDNENGWNVLGPYTRHWYDPETGKFMGSEHYWMMEDRTVEFQRSASEVITRREERLPDSVIEDYERYLNREFEKNGNEPGGKKKSDDSGSQQLPSRANFTAVGPNGSVGNVNYSSFIDVGIYPYMLNSMARCYTESNVDRLGGNFFTLRECCGGQIVHNTNSPSGWVEYGAKASRTFLWASWQYNCTSKQRGAGGAAGFEFGHNGQSTGVLPFGTPCYE